MITAVQHDHVDLASIPSTIPNQIGHQDARALDGRTFAKVDPATGRTICQVARSTAADVELAAKLAKQAQPASAATTVAKPSSIPRQIATLIRETRAATPALVATEHVKTPKCAPDGTGAAIDTG